MAKVIRKNKFLYYIKSFWRRLSGKRHFEKKIKTLGNILTEKQKQEAEHRIKYYHQFSGKTTQFVGTKIKGLKKPKTPKAYYFDTYEYARYFDENLPINFVFGDVTAVPEFPSIVKSRPINENNENSILLNLDKARHFVNIENDKDFAAKKNRLIGRSAVYQPHRIDFYDQYFNHPLCDLGQTNTLGGNPKWIKPKISIQEHLDYKFILSLEGNDVATNLKWIMSSNSIAVMPKPTMETWFMEGTLEGGKHYIEIKDDFSDLEAQLQFYIANPEKCLEIIKNANEYRKKFMDKNVEDYCSLKVLEKYFNV